MVRASASWSRLGSRSMDWSCRKMRRFLIEPPAARAGFPKPRRSSAETPRMRESWTMVSPESLMTSFP